MMAMLIAGAPQIGVKVTVPSHCFVGTNDEARLKAILQQITTPW
jgi:hypothetical protein